MQRPILIAIYLSIFLTTQQVSVRAVQYFVVPRPEGMTGIPLKDGSLHKTAADNVHQKLKNLIMDRRRGTKSRNHYVHKYYQGKLCGWNYYQVTLFLMQQAAR